MPMRPSVRAIIEQTVQVQATQIVQETINEVISGGDDGTGTGTGGIGFRQVVKTVADFDALVALPAEDRLEGVLYIDLKNDVFYLWDKTNDAFISTVNQVDGGGF